MTKTAALLCNHNHACCCESKKSSSCVLVVRVLGRGLHPAEWLSSRHTLESQTFRRTRVSGAPGRLLPRALKLPSCRFPPTEPPEEFLFGIECAPRSTPSNASKQCNRA